MQHFSEKTAMQRYMKILGASQPFFLNPNYNLEDLCKDLQTNRAYASRFVNKELGTSLPQLLRSLRLAYAERLTHNFPNMSITDIARSSGFNNLTSYRRAYVEKYGCTPSEGKKNQ
ncbi:MAG: helix-turn-helix transcriptional regulator [Bacteroidales bacterium]|nr:helix-turn-helix transcriptional regulator [Bacteroidales bacterium]